MVNESKVKDFLAVVEDAKKEVLETTGKITEVCIQIEDLENKLNELISMYDYDFECDFFVNRYNKVTIHKLIPFCIKFSWYELIISPFNVFAVPVWLL